MPRLAMDSPRPSAFAPLRHPGFRLYAVARLALVAAGQMISVAIGWQVYEATRDPLQLGFVGLAQFLPGVVFALVSGPLVDRLDRRKIILACIALNAGAAGLLVWQAGRPSPSLAVIYAVSALFGAIRSFSMPAGAALIGSLVPAETLSGAVAWQMAVFQAGMVGGPALGGLVYSRLGSALPVYELALGFYAIAFLAYLAMRPRPFEPRGHEPFLRSLGEGLRYVWREKLLLGAMSLDLFAVLLGGVTALLPVFARDILLRGPEVLGILKGATAVGAGAAAVVLALRPMERRVGFRLLLSVALFGAATFALGFCRSLPAAWAVLAFIGAADMVSVVVRHTLIQMCTPEAMRGRVSAVAFVFIGASNELGEFESGLTARWWGTLPAILFGGAASLAVVVLWALAFPELRRADRWSGDAKRQTV
jgi:MFS family permease